MKDLWKMNISLMCKWWWKLERNEGLWQEIVRKKYVNNCCLISLKNKPTNFPVWNELLSIKDIYIAGRKVLVGKSDSTSFWRDSRICDTSLKDKFPQLFEICNEIEVSVAWMARDG